MAARVDEIAAVTTGLKAEVAALRARLTALQARIGALATATASTPTNLAISTTTTTTLDAASPAGEIAAPTPLVRAVVQRCDAAELLVDNAEEWVTIGWGLVVFVSFGKGCTLEVLPKVVKQLLNLPLLTAGVWGDGSTTSSIVAAARASAASLDCDDDGDAAAGSTRTERGAPSVMLIPSAGLISKVKGKGLQYRGQCDKDESKQLYTHFVGAAAHATRPLYMLPIILMLTCVRVCFSPPKKNIMPG